jgi:NAD-dependent SIR2 family protein deacetylase
MQQGTIRQLANRMEYRRRQGERPLVLVVGAGASLSSGASSGGQVIAEVVKKHSNKDVSSMTWDQELEEFYEILDHCSPDVRFAILKPHIEGKVPSEGYRALAELARRGYFELILSTNYDTFLEDAFSDAGLHRRDFDLLINGVHNENEMLLQLDRGDPPIKVIKLHGDLHHHQFAFTPQEIWQFSDKIEGVMHKLLSRDFVIVGHSMRDNDINRCIDQNGGSVWYVNPSEPAVADSIGQVLRVRPSHLIVGELGRFDDFFVTLHSSLP